MGYGRRDIQRYRIEKKLSNAIYGDVVLAIDLYTNAMVVIKRSCIENMVQFRPMHSCNAVQENGWVELEVYKALDQMNSSYGSNTVQLLDSYSLNGMQHVVLEYCPLGELYDHLQRMPSKRFTSEQVQVYFIQILHGIYTIHQAGYAHRDLSLENVLLDSKGCCKLSDFGLAVPATQRRTEPVGKLFYMAPEVVAHANSGNNYSFLIKPSGYIATKADVWSLGVVLFVMITGAPPVESASRLDDRFNIIRVRGIQELIRMWKMENLFTNDLVDLLQQMLCVDPTKRISIDAILLHRYVQGAILQPHINNMIDLLHKILPKVNIKSKLGYTNNFYSSIVYPRPHHFQLSVV